MVDIRDGDRLLSREERDVVVVTGAGPAAKFKVGDEVELTIGSVYLGYESPSGIRPDRGDRGIILAVLTDVEGMPQYDVRFKHEGFDVIVPYVREGFIGPAKESGRAIWDQSITHRVGERVRLIVDYSDLKYESTSGIPVEKGDYGIVNRVTQYPSGVIRYDVKFFHGIHPVVVPDVHASQISPAEREWMTLAAWMEKYGFVLGAVDPLNVKVNGTVRSNAAEEAYHLSDYHVVERSHGFIRFDKGRPARHKLAEGQRVELVANLEQAGWRPGSLTNTLPPFGSQGVITEVRDVGRAEYLYNVRFTVKGTLSLVYHLRRDMLVTADPVSVRNYVTDGAVHRIEHAIDLVVGYQLLGVGADLERCGNDAARVLVHPDVTDHQHQQANLLACPTPTAKWKAMVDRDVLDL